MGEVLVARHIILIGTWLRTGCRHIAAQCIRHAQLPIFAAVNAPPAQRSDDSATPARPLHTAVVVLSYQSKALLDEFLPGIIASASARPHTHVWVVDNASTDGTTAHLQANYPRVKVLTLSINRGFTNGYVESLPQIEADVYVLINSDVAVTPDWLTAPLALLEANPQIAAVQPKILAQREPHLFEYSGAAGGLLDRWGYPFCRGRILNILEADAHQYDDARPVFWGSGACLFIRADVYHQVGGLDNSFYAHMEEIDLCWRLQSRGWQVWVCPASTVYHVGGSVIKYNSPAKLHLNIRNSLAMLVKNVPGARVWWMIWVRLVLDGVAGLVFLAQGRWRETLAIVQAHFAFYGRLGRILQARKANLAARKPGAIIHGWERRSIVWSFFVRKQRYYSQLQPVPNIA